MANTNTEAHERAIAASAHRIEPGSPLDEIERLERELHDVKVAYHELRTLVLAIKDLVA